MASTPSVAFPPGPAGFIALLQRLQREGWSGRLVLDLPGGGDASIDLIGGELRAAACRGFAGMTVLTTCALFATGAARLLPPVGAVPDQFGVITAVLLDHLQGAVERIQTGQGALGLPLDAATGTPIPNDGTDPTALAQSGRMRVRRREDTATSDGEDFADLIPDELRGGSFEDQGHEPAWLPPPIGQMLGKCYLSAEIGAGATAVVFKALQLSLRVDVAVKVFRPDSPAGHLSIDEARLLARLSHPHIVRVLDCSDEPPWPHLVAEFVDGSTLAEVIAQSGRLAGGAAVALLAQAAEGFAYAAAQEVVHGDIKPGNILVGRDQVVKITDFGVARIVGQEDAERRVVGTPAYIAPEQVSEGSAPDARSDVYSFGATLFHAVAGRPPFLDEDPLQLMVRHVRDPLPRLRQFAPEADPRLERLCARLLARDPAARPRWPEVAAELRRMHQERRPLPGLSALAVRTMGLAREQIRRLLAR